MADIFDELLGPGVPPSALAAELRRQAEYGTVGAASGSKRLAPLGNSLREGALAQAGDVRDRRMKETLAGEQNQLEAMRAMLQSQERQADRASREGIASQNRALSRELTGARIQGASDLAAQKTADKERLGGPGSAKEMATARDKSLKIGLAKKQLQLVKDTFAKAKGLSAGPGANYYAYTPSGRAFDKAVDAMRSSITSLTRTAGVGSMSDYETKLDQAKMPSRGEFENVTAQQIQSLEDMLQILEEGYGGILQGGAQAPASSGDPLDDAMRALIEQDPELGALLGGAVE